MQRPLSENSPNPLLLQQARGRSGRQSQAGLAGSRSTALHITALLPPLLPVAAMLSKHSKDPKQSSKAHSPAAIAPTEDKDVAALRLLARKAALCHGGLAVQV